MATTTSEKMAQSSTTPPPYSPSPINVSSAQPEMSFIHQEPPMAYQPPNTTSQATQPVPERGPRLVTPLDQVRSVPVDVDCPSCKRVVRTEVREISSDDDGFMQCLICLVCWPMLFCYEGNKDINHHCSVCKRQLTHQPHNGPPQVVASAQTQQRLVASQYEQS